MVEKETFDPLCLDNQLCFPLYVCAKEIVNKYTPYLNELGLTYTQYITMMVMWEEKQVVTRHLKERLFLDSGTLTPVLKKLEEKGFVTRRRSEEDARDLIVTITKAGEDLRKKAVRIPQQVGACISEADEVEDIQKLYELLRNLMDSLRQKQQY